MELIKKNALVIVLILLVIAVAVYMFIRKDKNDAIQTQPKVYPGPKPPVSVIQNNNDPYYIPGGVPKPTNTTLQNPIILSNTNSNVTG
jgi:hypothetical protein